MYIYLPISFFGEIAVKMQILRVFSKNYVCSSKYSDKLDGSMLFKISLQIKTLLIKRFMFFLDISIFLYLRVSEIDNKNPIFNVAPAISTIFNCKTKKIKIL